MTSILLTGKNGQVGAELESLLSPLGNVVALDRRQLDLCNPNEIRRVARQVRPQIFVNAAAYTAVDKAETEEKVANAVNADAPAILAEEANKIGAVLVHYSTNLPNAWHNKSVSGTLSPDGVGHPRLYALALRSLSA